MYTECIFKEKNHTHSRTRHIFVKNESQNHWAQYLVHVVYVHNRLSLIITYINVLISFVFFSVCFSSTAKVRDLEKTTIAIIIGAGSAIVLGVVSLIAFIIHRIRNPISNVELEKSYSREFGDTHRGSTNGNELYRNDSTKKPGMEIPFTATNDFDEDGDPDLIPTSKNGTCVRA